MSNTIMGNKEQLTLPSLKPYQDKVDKQQDLLHSTKNYIQHHIITYNEKEYEKEYIYIYITEFSVHPKLTQHCKSTILKLKKKNLMNVQT